MHQAILTYAQLEQRFVAWAQAQPDVRAAIVVGSRARVEHPADEWSDLDLILYLTDPQRYAASADWLEEIAEVWVPYLNHTGRGEPEWLVWFAAGLKADFVLTHATGELREMIRQSPHQRVLGRGARVLLDKDSPQTPVTWPAPAPESPPTEQEFLAAIHGVLIYAGRAARLLKRGELWPAKLECDCHLKRGLLTMLEWHARAVRGSDLDTWHGGRFLEEWADPQALAALPATFAAYKAADLWRALFATLDLFHRLAAETAERLDYPTPTPTIRRVWEWLRSIELQ